MARKRVDKLIDQFPGMDRSEFVGPIRRGVQSFVEFMDPESVDWELVESHPRDESIEHRDTFWQTRVGAQAHDNDVWEAKCLLDYVYLWLAQGPAGLHCRTYESYLMSIIAIIDEFLIFDEDDGDKSGWLKYFRHQHGRRFYVFYWGTEASEESKAWDKSIRPTSEALDYYYPGVDAANMFENVALDVENYDHPALRRDAYEFYRRRVLAEDAEQRLKKILRDVIASKK